MLLHFQLATGKQSQHPKGIRFTRSKSRIVEACVTTSAAGRPHFLQKWDIKYRETLANKISAALYDTVIFWFQS
jgi:hypothetical protein